MTNSTIVDTDILIDAGRAVIEAVTCLQNLKASSSLAISIITRMELMVGCRNKAELQTLENFLKQFYIIKIRLTRLYLTQQLIYCGLIG